MAHAESFPVRVNTPLSAAGMTIPVGNYTLATLKGSSSVMLLEGKGIRTFVFGHVVRLTSDTKPAIELHLAKPAAAVAAPVEEPVKVAVTR